MLERLEGRLAPAASLVRDINTNTTSAFKNDSIYNEIVSVNEKLYFTAYGKSTHEGYREQSLWVTDGTSSGTTSLDIYTPRDLTNVNGTLFFIAHQYQATYLWKTDGTKQGTINITPKSLLTYSTSEMVNVNGILFFQGRDANGGLELWKSDGTTIGTVRVKDINSGQSSSIPKSLTNVNGVLYFTAYEPLTGRELWKSDGTESGTVRLSDIEPGSNGAYFSELTNGNGILYFTASNSTFGSELWKSDGSMSGTVLVKDIWPGSSDSTPNRLTFANNLLYFSAQDGISGRELWKSDGTDAGTLIIKDIRQGNRGSIEFLNYNGTTPKFAHVGGILYFEANDGINGYELWKSNGELTSTNLVKDINISDSSMDFILHHTDLQVNLNGSLIFSASDGINGYELWKSDGTAYGTRILKDIAGGHRGSRPSNFTIHNGCLFFLAFHDYYGIELWKSDGTVNGTLLIKDIDLNNNGSGRSRIYGAYDTRELGRSGLVNIAGTLFFQANDGKAGYELWRSDGTLNGTKMVKEINPGPYGCFITNPERINFENVNGILFFAAFDSINGYELWKSDGTESGTVLVKNIFPGSSGSYPSCLTNINGTLYFACNDGKAGVELWKSDGTETGTVLVKDLVPGLGGLAISNIAKFQNSLVFFTRRSGDQAPGLYKSNGTEAGTELIKQFYKWYQMAWNPVDANGLVYFRAYDELNGTELWRTDGTSIGTFLIKDINQGNYGSTVSYLTNVNGTLFFQATTRDLGRELWKTDGTADGTLLVKDLVQGDLCPKSLTNINGILYFFRGDGRAGELWKSDGTSSGTVRVVEKGPLDNFPPSIIYQGNTLYFSSESLEGHQLWKSDGSSQGTMMLVDALFGNNIDFNGMPVRNGSSFPLELVFLNQSLFFFANDGARGRELWKYESESPTNIYLDYSLSLYDFGDRNDNLYEPRKINGRLIFYHKGELVITDGTKAGTVSFKRNLGLNYFAIQSEQNIVELNGLLYFSANQGDSDTELWRTDGTLDGTARVKDIRPGVQGSNPFGIHNINGVLYFFANDGEHGAELWKSDGTADGTVLVKNIKAVEGFSSLSPTILGSSGSSVYFSANDGLTGFELWSSDGTEHGTKLVKDVNAGIQSSLIFNIIDVNGVFYFRAKDNDGYELWRTDGTYDGTFKVKDIVDGPVSSWPRNFVNVSGTLFFTASDLLHGEELWKTDGTESGTILVRDISSGYQSSDIRSPVNVDGKLLFIATDGIHGNELWISNGTSAGTQIVTELSPGRAHSIDNILPSNIVVKDGSAYFVPSDLFYGRTIWRTDGTQMGTNPFISHSQIVNSISSFNDPWNLASVVRGLEVVGNNLFFVLTNPVSASAELFVNSPLFENNRPGDAIARLITTDPDTYERLFNYTLVAGSGSGDNEFFEIHNNTLIANISFDFETKAEYNIRVRATDPSGLFIEKPISVFITDVNEMPLDLLLSTNVISENSGADSLVGLLSTKTENRGSLHSYSLVPGQGDADNISFSIVGNRLLTKSSLDFESKSIYHVRIRSIDASGVAFEKAFDINVRDLDENFLEIRLSHDQVHENKITGSFIGFLTLSSNFAQLTFGFSFASGQGSEDNHLFSIVGNQLKTNTSFDFESRSIFSIRVRASGQEGLGVDSVFAIKIVNINEVPSFLSLSPSSIAENAGAQALIGSFTTSDPDVLDTFTYSLVTDSGFTDNTLFNINGNQLRANSSFNFESRSNYSVRVRTTDQGGLSFERLFAITVTNVNESPTALSLSTTSIAENAGSNALVGMLTTSDPDAGNIFTYSMVAGTGSTDNGLFNISGNQLRANGSFDFESKSIYSVRVRTTDQNGLSFDQVFTITVRNVDEGPSLLAPISVGLVTNQAAIISGLSVVDPFAGATRLTTTLSVPSGKLTLGTRTGLVFLIGDGVSDATIRFTGTLSQTNAALKSLTYITATDTLAATTLSVLTQRGTLTGRSTVGLTTAENRVARVSDPSLAGKVSVVIQGTGSNDSISVQRSGITANYTVTINGAPTVLAGVTGRFIVFGLGGDDSIAMTGSALSVRADGGEGHDVIQGGSAADTLFGGNGADLLAGGLGADNINGGTGNDIIIDGTVAVRTAGKTLRSILDGWALLSNPVDTDYAAITTDLLFTADKASKDTLTGGLGTDWFWSPNTTGILADTLDKTAVERRRTV